MGRTALIAKSPINPDGSERPTAAEVQGLQDVPRRAERTRIGYVVRAGKATVSP